MSRVPNVDSFWRKLGMNATQRNVELVGTKRKNGPTHTIKKKRKTRLNTQNISKRCACFKISKRPPVKARERTGLHVV